MDETAVPDYRDLERDEYALTKRAEQTVVTCDEEYDAAGIVLKECKVMEKRVLEFMGPIVKAAHASWKQAKKQEDALLTPIKTAQAEISRAMGRYQAEVERERREQEAVARAIAEQEARESAMEYAQNLADHGMPDVAHAVLNAPVPPPEVKIDKYAPKVDGTAVRHNWTYEIVAPELIPRQFLTPDTRKIGQYVRAMKEAAQIPGVRVYTDTRVHARG